MIELGSSDAAVVMGCSPFKTPWRKWAECVGLLEEDEYESEIMSWGTILQDTVLREFCLRERWIVEKDQPQYHHRSKPYLRATPDGLVLRNERGEDRAVMALVEVKTFVGHVPDVPRIDHLCQCLHQRYVTESIEHDLQEQYLVYFGGLRMVSFEIPRHQKAMDRVLREEEKFLELVEKEIPPPVSARDASALNRAWPWVDAKAIALPDTLLAYDAAYADAQEKIKVWTEIRDEAEAAIKAEMGEASEGLFSTGAGYTWRYHARGGFTVPPNRVRPFKRHAP